jgi:hypothetical protein
MAPVDATKRHIVRGQAWSLMAAGAGCGLMGDPPPRVCESRASPCCGVVAGRARARRRETIAGMVRDGSAKSCSALPLSGVATVAICWRHGGTGVAKVAGYSDVRAGQREPGGAMVEDRAEPGGRGVARRAGGWIPRSDVIRYRPAEGRGALPSRSVATVAIGRQRAAVVPIHVAQRAGDSRVRARQRKGCSGVIES